MSQQENKKAPKASSTLTDSLSKNDEPLPILRYGIKNNFSTFKRILCTKAGREYGHLANFLETGYYFEPEKPIIQDLMKTGMTIQQSNKTTYFWIMFQTESRGQNESTI